MTPYGTPVSPELQRALDKLIDLPAGTGPALATLAGDYPRFTWFNGCYYGKYRESGRWYLQYCNLYQSDEREADANRPRIDLQIRRFPTSRPLASGGG